MATPGRGDRCDPSVIENQKRIYYAMTANLDRNLGRLMHALDKAGIADDTILVFTSDHGEMFGSHGRRAKNIFYEEAARVPFVLRYPRKVKGGMASDAVHEHRGHHAHAAGLVRAER